MSLCKTKLCQLILKEHFGQLAEKVGTILLSKGSCHLRQISQACDVEMNKVRKVLACLIQQNLVTFEKKKQGFYEYSIETGNLLCRVRIPRYIYCAKSLYGDGAELLIEDILHNGQILMSSAVGNVTEKLNEALEHAGHAKISSSLVHEKFASLAKTHFIQRCCNPLEEKATEERDERELEDLYLVPPLSSAATGKKRKRSVDDSDQQAKKQKTDVTVEDLPSDDGIYWRISCDRFHQYFLDQMFVQAACKKIDKRAGEVLQSMLRISETSTESMAFTTNPMSFTEIFTGIPREHGITKHLCEQYLSILADDATGFVDKVGESGGGMYIVNIMKTLTSLCEAHLESVVQERFGSKSLRLFRVLLLRKHLEQKQIEEMAMIPSKEAKELLYTMFAENFVTITEISKTPDHAPARTYYFFRVHIEQLARMLLYRCYKSLANLLIKRDTETRENKRLMEKKERVDAILASVDLSGADEAAKDDILQTITPAENTQLNKIKHMINMLEQAEMQLDDTIFILETFLRYHDQKLKQIL